MEFCWLLSTFPFVRVLKNVHRLIRMHLIVKLKVPLQVPLKVKVKVKVKIRTWSGQVISGQTLTPTPTQMWDLSYTLKLVSTHHHHPPHHL